MITAVKPALERLRDLTGETACLFRREGTFMVCVAMSETRHAIRREMHVGKILPLHAGSVGRVLLAWDDAALHEVVKAGLPSYTTATVTDPTVLRANVEQTRRVGYATTTNELDEGATGVSAPSAQIRAIFSNHSRRSVRAVRAPSRSWTLAAVTTTTSSSPIESTRTWRLRPATFLPASHPRLAEPTVSAARTDCESMTATVGSAARPWGRRTRSRRSLWTARVNPARFQRVKMAWTVRRGIS